MSKVFIIEGHGVVKSNTNISPKLVNRMRMSGDISFYNMAKPAETISDMEVSESILNLICDRDVELSKLYHEGSFKKNHSSVDYITTSIQDKILTSLSKEEWLIKDIIERDFKILYDVKHVKFYQNKKKEDVYYIRVARGWCKEATLSEILGVIYDNKDEFKGNKVFVWAACRSN